MIPVRQAILLTGIVALVMVLLAAMSMIAPWQTASEGPPVATTSVPQPATTTSAPEVPEPPSDVVVTLGETVSRGELAVLLSQALGLSTRADDPFVDDDGSIYEPHIERLAAAGITGGCNPPRNDLFCPEDLLTRAQVAAMLSRGFGLSERADDPFVDDDGSIFEADIERLAAAGITSGCNPPTSDKFCPDRLVTGEEMAAFLARAAG